MCRKCGHPVVKRRETALLSRVSPGRRGGRIWSLLGQGQLSVRQTVQALVYDILPTTTAVFSYAIGSRKLSANAEQGAGVSRFLPADYFGIYSRIAVVLPQ